VNAYGEEGEDWRPHYPNPESRAGVIAAGVAADEDLLYEKFHFAPDVITQIQKAEDERRIVAIIVDGWTLQLEAYREVMEAYGQCNFVNCAVVVPIDDRDEETRKERENILTIVEATFANDLANQSARRPVVVGCYDELKLQLAIALNNARARVTKKVELNTKAQNVPRMPSISGVRC
jgi:FxsC-like protein